MGILGAALFTGASAGLIAYLAITFIAGIRSEKRHKARSGQADWRIGHPAKNGFKDNLAFIADKIGKTINKLKLGKAVRLGENIRADLTVLGDPYNKYDPYTFMGIQVICGAAAAVLGSAALGVFNIILLAAFACAGFLSPLFLLRDKVKARHKEIFRQLPDVIDIMSLMIEAGIDFDSALNKVITFEKGPLTDEFALAQNEIRLGKPRFEAFAGIKERIRHPHVDIFINSITVALATGGSMASTLKTLSSQFRAERFNLAEKMAAEAPVKLMFPLVLLIFPTVFIILFGPILISFLQ